MKSVRVAEDKGWGADANSGSSSEWAGKIEFEEFENSDSGTNSGSGTTSVHEVTSEGGWGSENQGGAIESGLRFGLGLIFHCRGYWRVLEF